MSKFYFINKPKAIDICVGSNLRSLREADKLTQTDLANKCGVSKNTISSIERGEFLPSLKLIVSLCVALDCPFCCLVETYDCTKELYIIL